VAGGDNVETPGKPGTDIKVDPKEPKLESEKTAKNLDSDKDKYEAGDTVVYTIKTRNTVTDSLVENLTISDKLPAGLTYVEGSLKAS
ncbi:cell surface protein, partial [Bacillus sonorensis L12]